MDKDEISDWCKECEHHYYFANNLSCGLTINENRSHFRSVYSRDFIIPADCPYYLEYILEGGEN